MSSAYWSELLKFQFLVYHLCHQVIQDPENYGSLKCMEGVTDAVLGKQMESLQTILLSLHTTL